MITIGWIGLIKVLSILFLISNYLLFVGVEDNKMTRGKNLHVLLYHCQQQEKRNTPSSLYFFYSSKVTLAAVVVIQKRLLYFIITTSDEGQILPPGYKPNGSLLVVHM